MFVRFLRCVAVLLCVAGFPNPAFLKHLKRIIHAAAVLVEIEAMALFVR